MDARAIVIVALLVVIAAAATTSAVVDILNRHDAKQLAASLD